MIHLKNWHGHPADQELLLVADRECSLRRAAKVKEHLDRCAPCRARMSQLESTLADFISLHEDRIQMQPPARTGVRASLKAQMSKAGRQAETHESRPGMALDLRQFAGACIALLIVAGSIWAMRDIGLRLDSGQTGSACQCSSPSTADAGSNPSGARGRSLSKRGFRGIRACKRLRGTTGFRRIWFAGGLADKL